MKESPIFARTHDLLRWLIPLTAKFPRSQRFVMANRLHETALDFQARIFEALKAGEPAPALRQADATLAHLRALLRLSRDLELVSIGQYEHGARMAAEIGRLLGGWEGRVGGAAVLRGGSWINNSRNARCAYRNNNDPDNFNNNVGFRLVLAHDSRSCFEDFSKSSAGKSRGSRTLDGATK